MYVRLTHFTIPEEQADEIKKIYYDEVAPVIKQQPGIVNVMLLEPVKNGGEFISCTVWNSDSDTKAFETSEAYPKVFGKIKRAAVEAPYQKYFNLTS